MRFTRPGARPTQRPLAPLDSTQLRRGVLGARIEDERAGAELGSGEVLQLVPAPIGRIELDVKVMVPAAAAGGLLVHGHDIWKRPLEEAVVLLQQAFERASKRLVVVGIEVGDATAMGDGRDGDLVRPARERRDERDPALVAQHGSLAAPLALDDVAVQAPTRLAYVSRLGGELSLDDRGHERVGVDLAVRMA